MIGVTWGAATDVGRVRARNEDALLAESPVFAVADGMGGHQGGEIASRLAVDTLAGLLDLPEIAPADVLRQIQAANDQIRRQTRLDPGRGAMGTTLVGLVLLTETNRQFWLAFNVGDSRLYRLHEGVLTQVSVDHSYVQELVLAGLIAPEEARTHPERSVITRALGSQDEAEPDLWVFPAEGDTRFLLCSDGLSGDVDDETIRTLLASDDDLSAVAHALVQRANDAGGRDNISVVVVDVTSSCELGT